MSRTWMVAALTAASIVAQLPALAPAIASFAPAFAAATIDPVDTSGAQFLSDTHTVIAQPGETLTFIYQFRNSGTTSWIKGGTSSDVSLSACQQVSRSRSQFSIDCGLTSLNPGWFAAPAPSIYADQTEANVAPGSLGTFSWQVTVPLETPAGEYVFLARLRRPEISTSLGPVLKQMVRIPNGNLYIVNDVGDGASCSTDICTLRGAITRANDAIASPGIDTIAFNLLGVPIISPLAANGALPPIADAGVVIDGTTQLGFVDRPLIELRGTSAGAVNGLSIQKPSTIRGLAINGFAKWAIEATAGGGGLIAGNFIGTNSSGNALTPNGTRGDPGTGGISVLTPSYEIGTETIGDGNIVSGNFGQGIVVGSSDAPSTTVMQNTVGLTRSGAAAGNEINGILVMSPDALVQDNIVASNRVGIGISDDRGSYFDNIVRANSGPGVLMSGSGNVFDKNDVRGNGSSGFFMGFPGSTTRNNSFTDNIVRDNTGAGFTLRGPATIPPDPTEITDTNTILRGSISNNTGKGIDLAFGANGGIAPPAITNVVNGTTLVVSGTAALNAQIQVYADPTDEGLTFLGSGTASDGDGSWSVGTWAYPDMTAIASALSAGSLRLRATQTTSIGTSEFSAGAATGIVGIATCNGDTRLYGANVELYSGSLLVATTIANVQTAVYVFSPVAPNATYKIRISKFVPAIEGPGGVTVRCEATTTTDGSGASSVATGVSIPNRHNHTWVSAYQVVPGATNIDYVFEQGQSTWFKVPITRGQRITVTVTNVPADYSVALYKNIKAIYDKEIAALVGADPLAAVHAHDASVAPDALSPDALSPDALSPDALSPDALSPDALSPDALSPDALSPDELSPDELSPDALSPDALSPDALSPDALSPDALSQAYSGAQTSALIGVSAHVGLSPEQISRNTWDNNDFFYVRVRGHNGAFDASSPFTIKVAATDVSCNGASLLVDYPQAPAITGTSARTLIITNTARLSGDTTAFKATLNTFKTRADVQGVVLDLATTPSFTAPYAQWDAKQSCPAAANILAHSIKDVIDAYAAANPTLRYVVLAGNDGVIPFFRQPDQSGLGSEKDYFPSVQEPTASQASLRLGYVLTQDFYGSLRPVSRMDHELYLPDLAVGRLVETIPQMTAVIDAYTFANGTVSPTTALVTGYDFLSDTAGFIATQLQANSLTVDRSLIQPIGDTSKSPTAWTGDQLKAKLLGATTFGILSLNSHFSANTLLAADFATRVRTSDIAALAAGDMRFRNSLVLSTGCHSGYNTVDGAQTALTDPVDWAQTFAARGATVVGGTGYQYGDTDFMKYSEQILANTTLELRYGAGGVPIGVALANAKRTYAATLPSLKGIDEKALAEATLYGLPMLGYNLPAATRLARPAETTVPAPTAGTSAGLSVASVSPSYTLTRNTRPLTNLGGTGSQTAVWYDINGSVAASPGAPVLPQLSFDVTKTATLARGAVLLAATYVDENALPFTDVATTEVRGAHARSRTDVFTPVRPFALNHNVGTHLVSTPFQFRSAPGLSTGVARRLTTETFRLYYSSLADARALASAPAVYTVNLAPDGAGNVKVTAIVGGLSTVGIEEIFATYTGEGGSLYGAWTSTAPLTLQSTVTNAVGAFAKTYVGMIPLGTTTANDLRVLIQAVGGNGLVSFASNDGAYYRVPNETATASDPKVTTALTLTAPASATYRSTVPVSATLSTAAGPLAGKPVAFRSGGLRIDATTNASGVASAQLFVRSAPGVANVSVGFAEEQHYLGSGAQTEMSVNKAPAAFTAIASAPLPIGGSALIATLRGGTELLGSQAVTLSGAGRTVQTYTDGYGRVRLDATDGFPSGAYAVSMTYDGNDRYGPASSTANIVAFDPNGFAAGVGSIVAGSDAVGFTPGKRVGFAFAAVYRRNATTPIGLFDVLSVDSHVLFNATSFDWLAVAGRRAEMLGHGNLNSQTGWSFRAVAVDGTPGTADRIEISIWQDGVTTYAAPAYRVTGTVARGIIVRLLDPRERDFSPLQLRGLAERE